ncbi:MAG: hypothetical protein ISF22_07960 [Methanomassiliicoccus sp.]|nr:hypothetical protein [Methanomassiliicoccus sp.]
MSTGDIIGLVLVYTYVAVVIAVATLSKKRFPGTGYRKVIHILVGNIVFLWWVFDSRYIMAFLAALPFVVLLLLVTPKSPVRRLNNSFLQMASADGHGYGLVYYAISWTLLALFLFDDRLVASIAIVAMSYGDGVGGLIGKKYGRKKLWKEKSYVGTSAVACGTFLATLAVIGFYTFLSGYLPDLNVHAFTLMGAVGVAAIVGVFVAGVELVSPGEYDNLIVPFMTVALVLTMQWLLLGGVP